MAESLVLFESVVNSRWFLRTSVILFLNKVDLFRVKLPKVPLEQLCVRGGRRVADRPAFLSTRVARTSTRAPSALLFA